MVYSAVSDDIGTISQFTRRKRIKLSHSGALTAYQKKLDDLDYESAMQADFDDIRFNTDAGAYIPHWIQSKTDSVAADVWVKNDYVDGDTYIYMYYGNPTLSSGVDIDNTMIFGDDWVGQSVPSTSKWVVGGVPTVVNDELVLNADSETINSIATFGIGHVLEGQTKAINSSGTNLLRFANVGVGTDNVLFRNGTGSDVGYRLRKGGVDSGTINKSTWSDILDYHNYLIARASSSKTILTQDSNTDEYTNTTYITTVNCNVQFNVFSGGSMVNSWVFVRKYTENEPTSEIGEEQHQRKIPIVI